MLNKEGTRVNRWTAKKYMLRARRRFSLSMEEPNSCPTPIRVRAVDGDVTLEVSASGMLCESSYELRCAPRCVDQLPIRPEPAAPAMVWESYACVRHVLVHLTTEHHK